MKTKIKIVAYKKSCLKYIVNKAKYWTYLNGKNITTTGALATLLRALDHPDFV